MFEEEEWGLECGDTWTLKNGHVDRKKRPKKEKAKKNLAKNIKDTVDSIDCSNSTELKDDTVSLCENKKKNLLTEKSSIKSKKRAFENSVSSDKNDNLPSTHKLSKSFENGVKKRKPNKRNKYRDNKNLKKDDSNTEGIEKPVNGDNVNTNPSMTEILWKNAVKNKDCHNHPEPPVEVDGSRDDKRTVDKIATENDIKPNENVAAIKETSSRREKKRLKKKNNSRNEIDPSKNKIGSVDVNMEEKMHKEIVEKVHDENSSNDFEINKSDDRSSMLRQKMLAQLSGGQFRYLNEQLYSIRGNEAFKMFKKDPDAYKLYHEGYRNQVLKWPVNPVDVIISQLQKMSTKLAIADFGCGDAKIAKIFPQRKVHSFDLIAINEFVTACDMSKVPLKDNAVDVVIFCLSLMGSNLEDYLSEANRILKHNGLLKVAELESRFENSSRFVDDLQKYGFRLTHKEELNDYFLLFDFKKTANIGSNRYNMPSVSLKPCLYKKR